MRINDRDAFDARIRRLCGHGLSDTHVAARLGCSPNTIRRARYRLGIDATHGPGGPVLEDDSPPGFPLRLVEAPPDLLGHGETMGCGVGASEVVMARASVALREVA